MEIVAWLRRLFARPIRASLAKGIGTTALIEVEMSDGCTRSYISELGGSVWHHLPSMARCEASMSDWLSEVYRYCTYHNGQWPDAHKPVEHRR